MIYVTEQNYLPIVEQAAAKYNVPVALILGHIRQESSFRPSAVRPEPAINDASYGMMQLLLSTAKSLDSSATVDKLYNPAYNIDLGTRYIRQNLDHYNNNISDAIAAYNAGTARKDSEGYYVNSKGNRNVQDYVNKVTKYYNEYYSWLQHNAPVVDVTLINPWLAFGFVGMLAITMFGGLYAKRRTR